MGSEEVRKIFKQADIIDLSNDTRVLIRGEDRISISGVASCTVCADNLDKVIEKLEKNIPSILLAHEPDFCCGIITNQLIRLTDFRSFTWRAIYYTCFKLCSP